MARFSYTLGVSATSESSSSPADDPVARARALAPLIREHADQAERERRLPKAVVDAMTAAGLYRVAAPLEVGGLETDPFTQIRVIEAVSEADGATGNFVTVVGIATTANLLKLGILQSGVAHA